MKTAYLSPCGRYRYALTRSWSGGSLRRLVFLMLNPSTADADVDDPTVRRCIRFARDFGYGSLVIGNLFAWRATLATDLFLRDSAEIVGPENDAELLAMCDGNTVVCGWGSHGSRPESQERIRLLRERLGAGTAFTCLGRTKAGQPRHPLYLRATAVLTEYNLREALVRA